MQTRVVLTGLPDSEMAKLVEVGGTYEFYNGFMSSVDNKRCKVISRQTEHTFKVRFENNLELLAYDSELKVIVYSKP